MQTSDPIVSAFFGAGYNYSSNTIVLDTAAGSVPLLTQLTAAEADETTGDYRSVAYALAEMLYTKLAAATPVPTKVSITRSTYEDTVTSEFVRTYTMQFRLGATQLDVIDEA